MKKFKKKTVRMIAIVGITVVTAITGLNLPGPAKGVIADVVAEIYDDQVLADE
ncbi:hypothetical protein [Reinekea sp.]|uniref:hypothetical protein n=1 Tax=Reinekea sp. TaxID=1970455 RepID=UPI003989824B